MYFVKKNFLCNFFTYLLLMETPPHVNPSFPPLLRMKSKKSKVLIGT